MYPMFNGTWYIILQSRYVYDYSKKLNFDVKMSKRQPKLLLIAT